MAQTAALSFCYAPPTSQQYDLCENKDLRNACQQIVAQHNCQIVITANDASQTIKSLVDTPTNYNITLTGAFNTLMAARGDLLRNCPLKIQLTLNIPASECSNLSLIRDHCNKIEAETHTTITIAPPPARRSSFSSENSVAILITGSPDHAELGRVRVLVMLDELANLRTETVKIPLKFQYLICGRRRAGLQPIIEETATNIYLPSPFITPSILDQMPEDEFAPPIYITGEPSNVSRVKDMLMKLSTQKAKSMYHKETMLHEQKIDWMLLHRRDELRKIMHDNGSFIELPLVGSGENRIAVYAENRVNVERTLRALNFLACSIYKAYFYFHDHDGTVYDASDGHSFFDSISNLAGLASQLSQVSGAEVTYKTESGCVEVLGTERAIRNVYQRLQGMSFLKAFHHYSIFRVESSNEQRDFISGKKNGKINKIMKTSGAKIRFLPGISDYNFIIEVESTSFTKALDGLTLLQEELPAEISFYVPESYHKRIIGVGGKNIQRIMKKYGVYVKFSNTEEFASLGGYYDNEDNVVARTPMKNQINLDNLRHAVMELIHPKDRDFVTQVIAVPFRLHRLLIHKYQTSFLTEEVTKKTNTRVLWPDGELASDTVTLIGPEAQMSLAVQMIQSIVPDEYDLHVPYTAVLVETRPPHHHHQRPLPSPMDPTLSYH
ncbi:uncharacterized protein BYT42DRAFT_81246 [Radiomyces spectabilis]|uniref:uncharacterized protein n=1 Tax=Radiomyces spectabilis TaxID=64574 RepID=UPI00221F9DE8|nr:uncharacterized protein BYT42DRAFT_81246 [Radiomyces spectabilis]KAI8371769.1 hypothetical protein BYT42DRAFT_81246 [Radiomyces spectabilis]